MKAAKLIKMANQIGAFFDAMPNREQAVMDVAAHIQKFWDPRMRRQIVAHLAAGGAGLDPMVLAAVKVLPPVATK